MRGVMTQWLIAPDNVNLDKVRDAYIANLRRSWAPYMSKNFVIAEPTGPRECAAQS